MEKFWSVRVISKSKQVMVNRINESFKKYLRGGLYEKKKEKMKERERERKQERKKERKRDTSIDRRGE